MHNCLKPFSVYVAMFRLMYWKLRLNIRQSYMHVINTAFHCLIYLYMFTWTL